MRIAFLHQPNDPYTEVRIKYFLSKGHDVYSIVFFKREKQKCIKGLKIIELPNLILHKIPFMKRIMYGFHIRKYTNNNDIDILYIVSALNSFYLMISKAKQNFLEIQGSDVIRGPKRFPLLGLYYKLFWRFADGITQDSLLAQEKGKEYFPKKKIINEIIEIGVNFSVFNTNIDKGTVRKKNELCNRPIVFHSRGQKSIYNVDVLIESLPIVKKQFNDVCYILTGNKNDFDDRIINIIKEKQLENNIIFCGRLDHVKEMKYYYMDADVTVSIPSSDSSPFSVYESMATKTPVIVTELPWLKGKFISGKHLLAVPVRESTVLAKSIIQLICNPVSLDINEAYQIVHQRINMIRENEKLEKLFERNHNSTESRS